MTNKRNVKRVTKEDLIKAIADTSCVNISLVRIVYKALEDLIRDTLQDVNFDRDVSIKIFDGISIDGNYIPEKEKQNNLTGKVIKVASKIKLKSNITRYYSEKINNKVEL